MYNRFDNRLYRVNKHPTGCHTGWMFVYTATSQLVTWSSRHRVMSSHGQLVTSQLVTHTRLITQSTRHKRAHNKTTSISLHAVRRHPETVLNTDGVITTISVTLMHTADYRSRRQIILLRKARSTRHNAVRHDGQLVTRFYGVKSWPCDELTGSRLHDTAGSQTGLYNRFDNRVERTAAVRSTRLSNRVLQPVWQQVVSCNLY